MSIEDQVSILVINDSGFDNLCKDAVGYVAKLKRVIKERYGDNTILFTITGKFGLGKVDNTIEQIEIIDKNKTMFGNTLENASNLFDELIVISIVDNDIFLDTAKEVMTTLHKTFTQYKYERK